MISVCLCTFRREHVFETLRSLAEQQLPDDVEMEIVVINNDPHAELKERIQRYADEYELAIKYDVEPIQNISHARNRSLELVEGDWVAFIDDDETAAPDWLATLRQAALIHSADAVMGVVVAEFPKGTPRWIIESGLFEKKLPQTGTILKEGRTSNTLLLLEWVNKKGHRFDPLYGLTGGEDSLFFQHIRKNGGKMISCREAIVYELNERGRLNMRYLIRRAIRGGEGFARINHADRSAVGLAFNLVSDIAKMIAFAGVAFLCLPFGRHRSVPPVLRSITQLGKLRYALGVSATELYKSDAVQRSATDK